MKKIYELQLELQKLLKEGDSILLDGGDLNDLIELGYNNIVFYTEDGDFIAQGYKEEDFPEELFDYDLSCCHTDVYEDGDGFTCVDIYLPEED